MATPKKKLSNPDSNGVTGGPSRPGGSSPSRLMFIPNELEIEGRPDLRKLPSNVVFAKVGINAGVPVFGRALYEPDLSSFNSSGSQCSLTYKNKYGGNCWVRITYHSDTQSWEGQKSVEGKIVGFSSGADWKGFFTHLTLQGLASGEHCMMESLPEVSSST